MALSTTYSDLIEEITSNLQGYTAAPDQVTSLTNPIGTTDTSIQVNEANWVSRGLIEVGTELMWVQSVNTNTGTLNLLPQGRGWRGSVAATHSAGDTVVVSPNVPRSIVAREINNQLRAMYPNVYGVATTEFVYNNIIQLGWGIPANAVAVLDVRWKDFRGNWQRIRTWEVEYSPDSTDFPTGVSLRFWHIPYGRTIQVVYATKPQPFVNTTDNWSVTGLSDGAKDLVVLGTMVRVLPNLDVSRLDVQYAPATELAQPRPMGSALQISKSLQQQYVQRLQEERTILNSQYPARIHFTR